MKVSKASFVDQGFVGFYEWKLRLLTVVLHFHIFEVCIFIVLHLHTSSASMCAWQSRVASFSVTSLLASCALYFSGASHPLIVQHFALNCRRDLLSSCKIIAGPASPLVDFCLDPGSLELDPCDLFIQQVTYILKAGDPGDRTPPIFFIFRQNLGWERENLQDCTALMPLHLFVVFAAWLLHTEPGGDSTGQGLRWEKQVALYISGQQQWLCSDQKASGGGAHTAILCLVFVFNINTSDLLYFDIMLLKTPDLCNLRTFVAIFFLSRFTHIFRQFLEAKKQTPPIYPLLECMQYRCLLKLYKETARVHREGLTYLIFQPNFPNKPNFKWKDRFE